MVFANLHELRHFDAANRHSFRASVAERTAGRGAKRGWRVAGDEDTGALALELGIGQVDRGEEELRIRVKGVRKELISGSNFDKRAEIHDDHAGRKIADHG